MDVWLTAFPSPLQSAPNEAVGVLALRDGKYGVIEYSEIDKELAAKRDEKTGELMFNAGHLCMNTYRIDFLEKAAREYSSSLPYVFPHHARAQEALLRTRDE